MTIGENEFLNLWPESRQNQFSYNALRAMFAWYEEVEEACGNEIEYDPIAFCGEWSEYESYSEAYEDLESGDAIEFEEETLAAFFQGRTMCLEFENGVLIGQY